MLHHFGGYNFEVVLYYFSVTKCYLMELMEGVNFNLWCYFTNIQRLFRGGGVLGGGGGLPRRYVLC